MKMCIPAWWVNSAVILMAVVCMYVDVRVCNCFIIRARNTFCSVEPSACLIGL